MKLYVKLADNRKEGNLDLEKIVADLKQERERINQAIAALEGKNSSSTLKKTSVANVRPPAMNAKKRGSLTPEGRKRLSLAMKRRWAERRKNLS